MRGIFGCIKISVLRLKIVYFAAGLYCRTSEARRDRERGHKGGGEHRRRVASDRRQVTEETGEERTDPIYLGVFLYPLRGFSLSTCRRMAQQSSRFRQPGFALRHQLG